MDSKPVPEEVLLISPPWPLFSRPSIQIGALKAYLNREIPGLKVSCSHFYLKVADRIGYAIYHEISQRTWLSESVYAALLYPSQFRKIEAVFKREATGKPVLENTDFKNLTRSVEEVTREFIDALDGNISRMVGLSVCLCQMTASLYLARQVCSRFPSAHLVLGGSLFSGESLKQLFEVFPEIDAVVVGEGESPITHMVRWLAGGNAIEDANRFPGIITRKSDTYMQPPSFSQLPDLKTLPIPDFDDYFNILRSFDQKKHFFPVLPVEISRGCWYRRDISAGTSRGCNFCNLNLQWNGYRHKSAHQVIHELDRLSSKHRLLSFAFMDNALPNNRIREFFSGIQDLRKDFRFFAEIRADVPASKLKILKDAGMEEVQIGIEALSTRMLKKLNKGTTAIQNIETMKHCEALGIVSSSNLLIHFPGSDEADVSETLHAIDFVLPFLPLRIVHFWLGLASPVFQNPESFGISRIENHPFYRCLFPAAVHRNIRFMIQSYKGDRIRQKSLWKPVKEKMTLWKKAYEELHQEPGAQPILYYEDGREFLIVTQRRAQDQNMTHRLTGPSRDVYLFCGHARSVRRILDEFPHLAEEKLMPFLKLMVAKRLMFEETGRFLSLAVPLRRC